MAKVLVIGGAGYIGSHVVKALLQKGHQATVYDNLSTGQKVNLFEKAEFVEGDILDSGRLFDTMRGGFDAVVHLAAKKRWANRWKIPTNIRLTIFRER